MPVVCYCYNTTLKNVDCIKLKHSGSADDLFHKSISGLMVAIFRTTFKSTTTTITVEDNLNCEKLSEIVLFSTVYEACELVVE